MFPYSFTQNGGVSEKSMVVTLCRKKQSLEMKEAGGSQSACILNGPYQPVAFPKLTLVIYCIQH